MDRKKKVLAISGSTRQNSSNLMILQFIKNYATDLTIDIYDKLAELPHFNPDLDKNEPPALVKELRNKIIESDGVIFCTPEYVFSVPGSLKNAIEWCVSTTVFSEKPVAIITASGLGEKAHESLQLIMKTIYARTDPRTQLLLQGARSKINANGTFTDESFVDKIKELVANFVREMDDTNTTG